MRKALRGCFWLETAIALVTAILFVITLIWRDWIEIVFNVDPDQRSGSLEWLIVGVLLALMIIFSLLARYEWRKAQLAKSL